MASIREGDRLSLLLADIEGTMRLNGRILNIAKSGNVYEEKQVEVAGKIVKKGSLTGKSSIPTRASGST